MVSPQHTAKFGPERSTSQRVQVGSQLRARPSHFPITDSKLDGVLASQVGTVDLCVGKGSIHQLGSLGCLDLAWR